MKTKLSVKILIGGAAAVMSMASFAGPGPGNWPPGFPTAIKSKDQAMACCLPKEKLALACKDCKTTSDKSGEDKKGVAAWFAPDEKHDCTGCSGKITLKKPGGDKGQSFAQYTHVCTKCGDQSAYTCATHKKG